MFISRKVSCFFLAKSFTTLEKYVSTQHTFNVDLLQLMSWRFNGLVKAIFFIFSPKNQMSQTDSYKSFPVNDNDFMHSAFISKFKTIFKLRPLNIFASWTKITPAL